jgi:hypothetical protein
MFPDQVALLSDGEHEDEAVSLCFLTFIHSLVVAADFSILICRWSDVVVVVVVTFAVLLQTMEKKHGSVCFAFQSTLHSATRA